MDSYYSIGIRFQFYEVKRIMEKDGGDDWMTT